MKKLFLLSRSEETVGWDENRAMIIRASNEGEARVIANTHAGDEGKIWASLTVKCDVIPQSGPSELIIQDFKAG